MNIHRNNYEAFLLDLLEGQLSPDEQRKLNEFLKDHPELVADFPDIDLYSLEKRPLTFPGRDKLKKVLPTEESLLTEANFDMFSIARLEGDLSPGQEQEHMALLAQDDKRLKEWHIWQKTTLKPEHINFPGKKTLKRRQPAKSRWLWLSGFAAAASLALLFVLIRTGPIDPEIAETGLTDSPPDQEVTDAIISEMPAEPQGKPAEIQEMTVATQALPAANLESTQAAVEEAREEESDILTSAEKIEPRPLRIASSLSSNTHLVGNTDTDRIEPLPVDPLAAKKSRIPMNEIAELDGQILLEEFTRERNISLLSMANASIKGINKLTGSDISLMASRDEQGDISGFRLKSKRFSISGPLAREKAEE